MQMDWVVGQINDALKKTGLDQNTLLFFTSIMELARSLTK